MDYHVLLYRMLYKIRFIFQNVRGKDSFLSKCPDQNVLSKACVTFLSETMKLDRDSRNTFPGIEEADQAGG